MTATHIAISVTILIILLLVGIFGRWKAAVSAPAPQKAVVKKPIRMKYRSKWKWLPGGTSLYSDAQGRLIVALNKANAIRKGATLLVTNSRRDGHQTRLPTFIRATPL